MSNFGELTNHVRDLIQGPIDSIDQVQILAVLASDPARQWTASEVAAETRLGTEPVTTLLRGMTEARLVSQVAVGDDLRFFSGASTLRARDAVSELIQMYNTRPVTLVRAIYSGLPKRAPTFDEEFTQVPSKPGDG